MPRLKVVVDTRMSRLLRCRISLGLFTLLSPSTLQPAIPQERECKINRNVADAANLVYILRRAIPEYRNTYGRFPQSLEQLGEPAVGDTPSANVAGIVHSKFLMARKYGYQLRFEAVDTRWRVWATPSNSRKNGCGSFYLEDDGKIRVRWNEGEASPQDMLMEGRLRLSEQVMRSRQIVSFPPVYPQILRTNGIQGDVRMRLLISQQGKVENIEVISGDPRLAKAAVDSVRKWVYESVTLDGTPVEVETNIEVRFRLGR